MKRTLIILVLLLSACTTPGAGRSQSGPIYGPTWPHGTCDIVSTCWPVDGAPRR